MQDFTIEEFENSMTIYYFKSSGIIHSWCTGINDIGTFREHSSDYGIILDFVVLPLDRYVIDNIKYFTVDTQTKELYFNAPSLNYKTR